MNTYTSTIYGKPMGAAYPHYRTHSISGDEAFAMVATHEEIELGLRTQPRIHCVFRDEAKQVVCLEPPTQEDLLCDVHRKVQEMMTR